MNKKCVIFDLDGTLLYTLEDLKNSVNFALEKNSFPTRTLNEVREFVGNGIESLMRSASPEGISEEAFYKCFCDFKEYYKIHSEDNTKEYDGITDVLKALKANGFLLAVVSNKADFAVKSLIVKYFNGLFSYSAGEKEGIPRKPAPDMVKNAIEFFGATADETLYVGDSEVDIETANNSSIDNVIVTWGFRDRSTLEEAGARNIAEDVKSLEAFILQ